MSWQIYGNMLKYGCTRLEIVVRSVYEDVARDTYIRNQSTESTVYMRSVAHLMSRQIYSNMLKYGCTRLKISVQSVYEDVARETNR